MRIAYDNHKACSKKDRTFALNTLLLILQHFKHCPLQSSPLYWRYAVPNVSSIVGMLPGTHVLRWRAVPLLRFPESQFSGCSSTTNVHSETGQMAVCCQNLTLGALRNRSALSVLVGALFKEFGLFLNTPLILLQQLKYRLIRYGVLSYVTKKTLQGRYYNKSEIPNIGNILTLYRLTTYFNDF